VRSSDGSGGSGDLDCGDLLQLESSSFVSQSYRPLSGTERKERVANGIYLKASGSAPLVGLEKLEGVEKVCSL
jgi:hypothetical protein